MSPLWRLAINDVRLTTKDRWSVFWLLILPVFLIWIFSRMSGDGGAAPVPLAVLDRDGGWLAQAFTEELNGPNVKLAVYRGAEADGPEAKKATRWIELSKGFTAKVLAGHQQRLKIETAKDAAADYSRAAEIVITRAIVRTLGRVAEMKSTAAGQDLATYDGL